MTIKQKSVLITSLLIFNLLCIGLISWFIDNNGNHLKETYEKRYTSYLLADELRQSSDDLTRLARTYVITGEEKYEEMYNMILDIRNGIKARPENYQRIYWDFYTVDEQKPRPDAETISLTDLMKEEGFTEEEFEKLREAQNNSDALVNTEVIAMDAIKGKVTAEAEKFKLPNETNFQFAYRIMHDQQYHTEKAKIMGPIDEFFQLVDQRTHAEVAYFTTRQKYLETALFFVVLVFCITAIINYVILNSITRPIIVLSRIIERLSNYNLTSEKNDESLKYLHRRDEIGSIAKALVTMRNNFIQLITDIADKSHQVAASSEALTHTSDHVSTAVLEVAKVIEDITRGTSNQAEDIDQGVEYIHELGKVIEKEQNLVKDINTSIYQVNTLKDEGLTIIKDLVDKTIQTNKTTKEIHDIIITSNESAEKIESASQMINSIAEQTNLLALNAAIEAARAGEHGKGFAIVAEEVRKLAEQSSAFTSEISSIINELTNKTGHAVHTMQNVGEMIEIQAQSVQITSEKFEGIAHVIGKLKQGMDIINQSGREMEQKSEEIIAVIENLSSISEEHAAGSQQASASVEEQTASMEEIAKSTEGLAKLAEEMQNSVSKFKR